MCSHVFNERTGDQLTLNPATGVSSVDPGFLHYGPFWMTAFILLAQVAVQINGNHRDEVGGRSAQREFHRWRQHGAVFAVISDLWQVSRDPRSISDWHQARISNARQTSSSSSATPLALFFWSRFVKSSVPSHWRVSMD